MVAARSLSEGDEGAGAGEDKLSPITNLYIEYRCYVGRKEIEFFLIRTPVIKARNSRSASDWNNCTCIR